MEVPSTNDASPAVPYRNVKAVKVPAASSIEDFVIIKPISRGAFGKVYLARKKHPENKAQVPVKGSNSRSRLEELEHQYTTLPRHVPGDPEEYQLRASYGDREASRYLGAQRYPIGYPHRGNYPRNTTDARTDPRIPDYLSNARLREAVYNPTAQYKGPHRQDIPPSPTQTFKMARHHDQGKMVYRESSPDRYRYPYQENQHQDPRQKNGMTAAV